MKIEPTPTNHRRITLDTPYGVADLTLETDVYSETAIYDEQGNRVGVMHKYFKREPLPPATPEALNAERKRRSCCDPPEDV